MYLIAPIVSGYSIFLNDILYVHFNWCCSFESQIWTTVAFIALNKCNIWHLFEVHGKKRIIFPLLLFYIKTTFNAKARLNCITDDMNKTAQFNPLKDHNAVEQMCFGTSKFQCQCVWSRRNFAFLVQFVVIYNFLSLRLFAIISLIWSRHFIESFKKRFGFIESKCDFFPKRIFIKMESLPWDRNCLK